MTVLITGAGLIAAHAAKSLADRREHIVFYDLAPNTAYLDLVMEGRPYRLERGDILDMANLMAVIKRHDIRGVVHTAAFLPERARANPSLCTRVNVEGAVNVFEAHRLAGLRRSVFISTIGVYDFTVRDGRPWEEDHRWGPSTYYGSTKLAAEMMGMQYAKDYGVDLVAVRFSSVFGISQYYSSRASAFMRDSVEPAALTGRVVIRRPFTDINQYLYAPDAGEAVALAYKLKRNPEHRVFNISDGKLRDVTGIIRIAKKAIPGASITITRNAWVKSKGTSFVPEPYSLRAARKHLGFKPAWPFEKAIAHYAAKVRERAAKAK
ncbi:NAD(P)-dependent oxidoreductase [Alphaproteobacteria bacterium]|nr:NAD(P)-dependent oxidoreductase [Alphaproteobacteria bacterium]